MTDRPVNSANASPSRNPRARLVHAPSLATSHQQLATSPAFTLIEILVVLAIVSIVVALGIPAFNALTGSKSIESGRNLVAATIGAARTVAVNEGKYAGVLFYIDPATERTAMQVVVVGDPRSGLEDDDPYEKYKTWFPQQDYQAAEIDANGNATRNDHVIGIAVDADATYRGAEYSKNPQATTYMKWFGNYRPVVRVYRCTQANNSNVSNRPPANGPYGTYGAPGLPPHTATLPGPNTLPTPESKVTAFGNQYWNGNVDTTLDRYQSDQQLLPKGVSLQVIVQQLYTGTGAGAGTPADRYLRTGLIMFDPQGRLMSNSYTIEYQSTLGQYLGLKANVNAPAIPSGIGIALYDDAAFKDKSFTQGDYTAASSTTATPLTFTFDTSKPAGLQMDALLNAPRTPAAYGTTGQTGSEFDEEQWLDNNATPLLINRFSGALSATQ